MGISQEPIPRIGEIPETFKYSEKAILFERGGLLNKREGCEKDKERKREIRRVEGYECVRLRLSTAIYCHRNLCLERPKTERRYKGTRSLISSYKEMEPLRPEVRAGSSTRAVIPTPVAFV